MSNKNQVAPLLFLTRAFVFDRINLPNGKILVM